MAAMSLTAAVLICFHVSTRIFTSAQVAMPPQILGRFPEVMYFSHFSDVQTLACKATGIPDVSYEWKRNGAIISDGEDDFAIVEGILTLERPQKRDEGYYQCFALNRHGTAMSSVVNILKADLPGFANLPVVTVSLNVGEHGVLTCRNKPNSIPEGVHDWYIDVGETVQYSQRVVLDQQGDLHFINIQDTDELQDGPTGAERTYNCSLYNSFTSTRVYGSPTRLRISPGNASHRGPSIHTYTSAPQSIAYVGQPVTFQCIPDGVPLPTIVWSKSGGSLPAGRHDINDRRYTLVINNVTEDDEGNYVCTAVQGSKQQSRNIFLDVKSAPIWVSKLKSLTKTEGQAAKFQCIARSAVGETDVVNTRWFKNGYPLRSGSTGKILVTGAELEVQNVRTPDDLMNIQCNVSNTVGYQIADAFLNVHSSNVDSCQDSLFGSPCQNCNCANINEVCDKVNGRCTSGCRAGFTGENCLRACGPNTYGVNCSGECHCALFSACNSVTGGCSSGGCQAGYQLEEGHCQTTCTQGTFDVNCVSNCHCAVLSTCDRVTGICSSDGCETGWTGFNCQLGSQSQDSFGNTSWAVAVGILSTLLLLASVAAAILFLLWRGAVQRVSMELHDCYAVTKFDNVARGDYPVYEELDRASKT